MKKTNVYIGLVVAVVIIVGGILFLAKKPSSTTTTNSASSSTATTAAATITYSDSGFSPATVTVKYGDTVAIKNTSSGDVQFDSNPHPVHTDDTDLNVGLVASGQTKTFTVTKKGSFGYHNHLNPGDMGKIVIE